MFIFAFQYRRLNQDLSEELKLAKGELERCAEEMKTLAHERDDLRHQKNEVEASLQRVDHNMQRQADFIEKYQVDKELLERSLWESNHKGAQAEMEKRKLEIELNEAKRQMEKVQGLLFTATGPRK